MSAPPRPPERPSPYRRPHFDIEERCQCSMPSARCAPHERCCAFRQRYARARRGKRKESRKRRDVCFLPSVDPSSINVRLLKGVAGKVGGRGQSVPARRRLRYRPARQFSDGCCRLQTPARRFFAKDAAAARRYYGITPATPRYPMSPMPVFAR